MVADQDCTASLLFQTGYLTIIDAIEDSYKLGIPNGEVRESLFEVLMPLYMGVKFGITNMLRDIKKSVMDGQVDEWLSALKSMMASAPYQLLSEDKNVQVERFYHLMVYQMFILLGINTRSEISVAGGRIDMVAQTPKLIYVMEFKLDGTPEQALRQINDKGYALPYHADGRPLFKIGISFSSTTHTIDSWIVDKE